MIMASVVRVIRFHVRPIVEGKLSDGTIYYTREIEMVTDQGESLSITMHAADKPSLHLLLPDASATHPENTDEGI